MNILKVKTLICFQNQKEQWNVTNLAVTLGEEKYAVSRVLTVLEKEGLIAKINIADAGSRIQNFVFKVRK